LQIEANYRVGQVYFSLGKYGPAIDVLARSVEALRGDLEYERFGLPALPSVISRTWLIQCLIERGDFALATVRGEEAVRIAEMVDHPFTLSFAYWGLGQLYLRKGEPARAVPVLERGYELCQAWNIRVWLSRFGSALGYAWAVSDRLEQALPLLKEAVNQAAEMRMVVYGSPFCASLGEAYLLAGRVKEATRLAERALELARTHRQRGHEAWALRLLGEIAVRAEPPDPKSAESRYRQAIALARELEMRPLLARCCQGLGTLLRPVDPRAAEPLLTTAATLCRDMDIFL
jgi:tetratricopeptide (TPR) repeat protein